MNKSPMLSMKVSVMYLLLIAVASVRWSGLSAHGLA